MSTMVSQITRVRCRSKKTSKPCITGFVRGIHQLSVDSPHKGPVTQKKLPFDDIIMTVMFFTGHQISKNIQNLAHFSVAGYSKSCCHHEISCGTGWSGPLGLYSLSGRTSYRKFLWSLEAARFGVGFSNRSEIWQAPRQMPANFRAIRS